MSSRAINAVTRSLTALLDQHLRSDPALAAFFDPLAGGNMEISARTPQEMATADTSGLSLWLYRVARDPELLNQPPRRVGFDRLERRRLPLRLHYMMTPVVNEDDNVGNDPGLEQFIIGRVLQTFHDHPRLSGPDLLGVLSGSGSEIGIRLEPLGLEEITRVWDALGATFQLCISYEVSFVMVASDEEPAGIAPVDVVEPDAAVIIGGSP